MIHNNTSDFTKFSMKDFFNKCDPIRRKLRIWSNLLKKPSTEKFTFCEVSNFKLTYYLLEFLFFTLRKYHVFGGYKTENEN